MAVLVIVLGFVVAWKWEALGSLLIVGGTAFLTIVNYGIQPLVFGTLLLSGLLFLYCWWRTPKRTGGYRWQESSYCHCWWAVRMS